METITEEIILLSEFVKEVEKCTDCVTEGKSFAMCYNHTPNHLRKKVYLVYFQEYDFIQFIGIYKNKENAEISKAEQMKDENDDRIFIHEFDLE